MRTVRDVYTPWRRSPTGQAAALALTIAAFTWAWLIPAAGVVTVLITRRYATLVSSALVLAPMVRVVSYLWSWATYLAGDTGHPTGWYPAVMHLPLLGLVVLIALLTRATRTEGVTW